jgi:hypothetical protein
MDTHPGDFEQSGPETFDLPGGPFTQCVHIRQIPASHGYMKSPQIPDDFHPADRRIILAGGTVHWKVVPETTWSIDHLVFLSIMLIRFIHLLPFASLGRTTLGGNAPQGVAQVVI